MDQTTARRSQSGERSDFADALAARVSDPALREIFESRRQNRRKGVKELKQSDDSRKLGPHRAVFDLDREADALFRNRDRMHTFRADLGDDPTVRLFDEDRVEAVASTDQKWPASNRMMDARRG